MSSRERWVIYPLLFFALALALRDKIAPGTMRATLVECEELRCHHILKTHELKADVVRGSLAVEGRLEAGEVRGNRVAARELRAGNLTLEGKLTANDVLTAQATIEGTLTAANVETKRAAANYLLAGQSLTKVLVVDQLSVVEQGKLRAYLGPSHTPGPAEKSRSAGILVLYADDDRTLASLGQASETGGATLNLFDGEGKTIRQLNAPAPAKSTKPTEPEKALPKPDEKKPDEKKPDAKLPTDDSPPADDAK